MNTLSKLVQKINRYGETRVDEPMSRHTSFKVGGPADIFFIPPSVSALAAALQYAGELGVPVFPLGSGANILVSDAGIEGLVILLSGLHRISIAGTSVTAESGAAVSDVSVRAAEAGLTGMEFLYSMPGSVGGAVWMNARCYGTSVSDILVSTEVITREGERKQLEMRGDQFGYKLSPFQSTSDIIVSACFGPLKQKAPETIEKQMAVYHNDRETKGHFKHPSAGSAFKNNRRFGEPAGALIDKLGLKGTSCGGAKIADYHANIIINTGTATAEDIRNLMTVIETEVEKIYGFCFEREIRLVGRW